MGLKSILYGVGVCAAMTACTAQSGHVAPEFVTVRDGKFYRGDSVYRYIGTNLWYGAMLGVDGPGGDRVRLVRELDSLQAMGIDNLRILAGAQGPEGRRYHVEPVMQYAPGVYNQKALEGLDFLLAELEKRGMLAVLYLNNAWEWSGGYGSYLEWAGMGEAPLPVECPYKEYTDFVAKFITNDSARSMFADHVAAVVGRVSSITGKPYSESPAIMSWQICNEPRAFDRANKEEFASWLRSVAAQIKSIDGNHLVSTGSEGVFGCEVDMDLWTRIHSFPEIDYANIHIWPYNWRWVADTTLMSEIDTAKAYTRRYISEHHKRIAPVGKPLVLEEFGYPRDSMAIALGSPVEARDAYYDDVFAVVCDSGMVAGCNFWGWGGDAVPVHKMWTPGDPFTGDPAQEPQGLYSVFAGDSTTVALIRRWTAKLR